MKKLSLLFATAGMAMLTACAPLQVDQLPTRTPTDFLLDIKAVADANDFTNIDAVGKRLRIDLVAGPEEPVYASDDKTLIGYGVTVTAKNMSQEYKAEDFWYRSFHPKNRRFDRALVSVTVNPKIICVTSDDLTDVFVNLRRLRGRDVFGPEYSYDGKNTGDQTYFRFEFRYEGCLDYFSFFKNNGRE
jgi:hypothetical protein